MKSVAVTRASTRNRLYLDDISDLDRRIARSDAAVARSRRVWPGNLADRPPLSLASRGYNSTSNVRTRAYARSYAHSYGRSYARSRARTCPADKLLTGAVVACYLLTTKLTKRVAFDKEHENVRMFGLDNHHLATCISNGRNTIVVLQRL